jgi:hypothetical protein
MNSNVYHSAFKFMCTVLLEFWPKNDQNLQTFWSKNIGLLLSRLLLPLLKKTADLGTNPRVVVISSFGHEYATEPMRLNDLNFNEPGWFKPDKAYFQSKVSGRSILINSELQMKCLTDYLFPLTYTVKNVICVQRNNVKS